MKNKNSYVGLGQPARLTITGVVEESWLPLFRNFIGAFLWIQVSFLMGRRISSAGHMAADKIIPIIKCAPLDVRRLVVIFILDAR